MRASAVFVGCARDCEPHLPGVLENVARFAARFARSGFVFIENDSHDQTATVLERWLEPRGGQLLRAEGLAARIPQRTARIATARNTCLEHVAQGALRDCDYLVVVDCDAVNAAPIDANSFAAAVEFLESAPRYAGVFACSDPVYYDVWALRHPSWCPGDVWAEVRASQDLTPQQALERCVYARQIVIPPSAQPINVESAFGGLAIYRLAAARGGRYAGLTASGEECCEHVAFNAGVRGSGELAIFPPLRNRAPAEHLRPAPGSAPARMLRLVQDGNAAELLAPPEHPLDRYRAAFPLYDRWLPRLARLLGAAAGTETMIDVGANIGDTVAACRLAGCTAPFVAVEPSARYFAFLTANLARAPALLRDVQPLHAFVGPAGVALQLDESRGSAAPRLRSGNGGPPTVTLAQVVPGAVSLVKTDTDGFDAQILESSGAFLAQRQPVIWAEAEVPERTQLQQWQSLLPRLALTHPWLCAFDNFGFPLIWGPAHEKQAIVQGALDYIHRQRAGRVEVVGEPRIYYLDIALFPERFRSVYEQFVQQLASV